MDPSNTTRVSWTLYLDEAWTLDATTQPTHDDVLTDDTIQIIFTLGQPIVVDLGFGFGHLEGAQLKAAIAVMLILELLVIVSNVLVLVVICNHRPLRTRTSRYIVSLAVSDFFCALGIPVGLLAKYFPALFLKSTYVCIFPFCFLMTVMASAVFNLLAVSIDRYIALANPLRHTAIITKRKSILFILSAWMMAVLVGMTPFLWHKKDTYEQGGPTGYCEWDKVIEDYYVILFSIFVLAVPVVIITVINILILRIAMRHAKSIDNSAHTASSFAQMSSSCNRNEVVSDSGLTINTRRPPENLSAQSSGRNAFVVAEIRVAFMIFMIVCTFVVCWMPLIIAFLVWQLCDDHCGNHSDVRSWLSLLALANSFCNPFIYMIRTNDFRTAFRELRLRSKNWCLRKLSHQPIGEPIASKNFSTVYTSSHRDSKSSLGFITINIPMQEEQITRTNVT